MPFSNRITIIRWDSITQHKTFKNQNSLHLNMILIILWNPLFCYIEKDPNISVVEACPLWIQTSCHSNWKYWGVKWHQVEIWWILLFLFVSNSSLHAHIWSSFKKVSSFLHKVILLIPKKIKTLYYWTSFHILGPWFHLMCDLWSSPLYCNCIIWPYMQSTLML
jgi:hypothetical protein